MYKVSRPYAVIVSNCLRLFVVVIYCYHGDGSDGRHVCTKYHGHTYYYQKLTLESAFVRGVAGAPYLSCHWRRVALGAAV